MKISYEKSGGVTGIKRKIELDSKKLPKKDMSKLEKLIKKSNFFHQKNSPAPTRVRDFLQYKITLEFEGKAHSIQTTDSSLEPTLEPLIEFLNEKMSTKVH